MTTQYYSVDFKEVKRRYGAGSASPCGCMCCGEMLSGMGGPGDYICGDCIAKMRNGDIGAAIRLIDRMKEE